MPIARPDMTGAASLGTCRTHRRPLLPERRADLAEQIATERLAEESRSLLTDDSPPPLPQLPRRRGHCPDCTAALAAAAAAYLNGADL